MNQNQRRKRKVRQRGRRHLLRIIQSPFSTCHWCGKDIVFLTEVPAGDLIEVHKNHWAKVRVDGAVREFLVGTVDHVTPIRDGHEGSNEDRNLVGACESCNRGRTKTPRIRPRTCMNCGTKIKGPMRRFCRRCRHTMTEEFALMHLGRS